MEHQTMNESGIKAGPQYSPLRQAVESELRYRVDRHLQRLDQPLSWQEEEALVQQYRVALLHKALLQNTEFYRREKAALLWKYQEPVYLLSVDQAAAEAPIVARVKTRLRALPPQAQTLVDMLDEQIRRVATELGLALTTEPLDVIGPIV